MLWTEGRYDILIPDVCLSLPSSWLSISATCILCYSLCDCHQGRVIQALTSQSGFSDSSAPNRQGRSLIHTAQPVAYKFNGGEAVKAFAAHKDT